MFSYLYFFSCLLAQLFMFFNTTPLHHSFPIKDYFIFIFVFIVSNFCLGNIFFFCYLLFLWRNNRFERKLLYNARFMIEFGHNKKKTHIVQHKKFTKHTRQKWKIYDSSLASFISKETTFYDFIFKKLDILIDLTRMMKG